MRYLLHVRLVCVALVLLLLPAHAFAGRTSRVTITAGGVDANDDSRYVAAVSADGRYVAFSSKAGNLVSGDANGFHDIFLKDMNDGSITLVSHNLANTGPGNGASYRPVISDDGNSVAFYSKSTDLVAGDTNGTWDVSVRYMIAGVTERVSISTSGAQGAGPSFTPSLSYDGRVVAFESFAPNLVAGDTNGRCDIFTHDLVTHTTFRVSLTSFGGQVFLGDNTTPSVSGDGNHVAFISRASDLGIGTPKRANIYLRNTITNRTTQITNGNADSTEPAVS